MFVCALYLKSADHATASSTQIHASNSLHAFTSFAHEGHYQSLLLVSTPHSRFFVTPPPCPTPPKLWSVFRRYREFVNLRQDLKTACQQQRQQQRAGSSTRGGKSHTPTKQGSERGTTTVVFSADGGGSSGGAVSRGRASSSSASVIGKIEDILSECRFPSKIALGRSFSLRQERRKALHVFLSALVRAKPWQGRGA